MLSLKINTGLRVVVFNVTFNNITVAISILRGGTGVPGENHLPVPVVSH